MTTEKVGTSIYLDYHLRQRLKRISNILNQSETSLVEDALSHYFSNSKIIREALRKINENARFLQELGCTKTREIQSFNSFGYEYRPQNPEEDEL